jgi:hypothetical protein
MTSFEQRNKEQQELEKQQKFIKSFFEYFTKNKSEKSTRTIDEYLGNVKLLTAIVSVYRTDHYTGSTEKIKDGIFEYSRYTVIIGGIRISANTYESLMTILGVING